MGKVLKNEKGVTIVELLATLGVFSFVMALFSGVLYSISSASKLQTQEVEFQQIGNSIVANVEFISQIDGIYNEAGYRGKFLENSDASSWRNQQIIKVLDAKDVNVSNENLPVISLKGQGSNRIAITDVLDDTNSKLKFYKVKDENYKIKILQQKNKNEVTKTQYGMPNYRDTFTVQTSVVILIYEGTIDFRNYFTYPTDSDMDEEIKLEELKKLENVKYCRETELTYRDEKKSEGGVPGDGRW